MSVVLMSLTTVTDRAQGYTWKYPERSIEAIGDNIGFYSATFTQVTFTRTNRAKCVCELSESKACAHAGAHARARREQGKLNEDGAGAHDDRVARVGENPLGENPLGDGASARKVKGDSPETSRCSSRVAPGTVCLDEELCAA